jgi:meso-butanediol dehydrogenase/(S,S)-butanediol dehydrogenase/diacetyl reductase
MMTAPSPDVRPLEGMVALCTGAGRRGGLGEAVLQHLSAAGCKIAATDLPPSGDRSADGAAAAPEHFGSSDTLEAIVADIRAAGGEGIALPLDVRDESQIETAIASIVKVFGRLDILINNAGIGFIMQPLIETSAQNWRTVIDVNLTGAFLCLKHAARQMLTQGHGGRIVNIASQAAKSGHAHLAAYSASKHGMVGLTRSAAIELGPHGITVNAVCPNHMTTRLGAAQNAYFAKLRGFAGVEPYLADMKNRIPLRRVGSTADTARACVFLCSDAASYITGEALNVSGGMEMH